MEGKSIFGIVQDKLWDVERRNQRWEKGGIKVVWCGKIKRYRAKMAWLGVNRLLVSTPVWLCLALDHLSLSCLIELYFNYFPG